MSYILEALKKIEQKQRREGVPRLLTVPLDVPEAEKKGRALLPYVIAAALVVNAVVMLGWWVVPWHHREASVPSMDPASIQESPYFQTPRTPSAPPVQASATVRSALEQALPTAERSVTAGSSRTYQKGTQTVSEQGVPASAERVKQSSEAGPRRDTESLSPRPGARLLDLGDLPPAVRDNLPHFKISGHAYSSEPRFRVARVNSKIVQEGEVLSHGLKVDEIVPGGVIFTYQGYRFKVGINDNP